MARTKRLIDQIKEEGEANIAIIRAAGMQEPLTDLHERLAVEYVKDLNMSAACRRLQVDRKTGENAGNNPNFLARVRQLWDLDDARRRTDVTNVLAGFWKVYDRCMQAEQVMEFNPSTKAMEPTGEWMFDSRGALKALEMMGKHLAMFTEKIDIQIKVGLADRVRAARERAQAQRKTMIDITPPKRGVPTAPPSAKRIDK